LRLRRCEDPPEEAGDDDRGRPSPGDRDRDRDRDREGEDRRRRRGFISSSASSGVGSSAAGLERASFSVAAIFACNQGVDTVYEISLFYRLQRCTSSSEATAIIRIDAARVDRRVGRIKTSKLPAREKRGREK